MAEGGGEGAGGAAEPGEMTLEYTPTWIVAAVCFVIVLISLVVERLLHRLGKVLKKNNQKALFEALQKIKEELMLLGFISLLLTVFQGLMQRICIPPGWALHMLPCKPEGAEAEGGGRKPQGEGHNQSFFSGGTLPGGRRLLSEGGSAAAHCMLKKSDRKRAFTRGRSQAWEANKKAQNSGEQKVQPQNETKAKRHSTRAKAITA